MVFNHWLILETQHVILNVSHYLVRAIEKRNKGPSHYVGGQRLIVYLPIFHVQMTSSHFLSELEKLQIKVRVQSKALDLTLALLLHLVHQKDRCIWILEQWTVDAREVVARAGKAVLRGDKVGPPGKESHLFVLF